MACMFSRTVTMQVLPARLWHRGRADTLVVVWFVAHRAPPRTRIRFAGQTFGVVRPFQGRSMIGGSAFTVGRVRMRMTFHVGDKPRRYILLDRAMGFGPAVLAHGHDRSAFQAAASFDRVPQARRSCRAGLTRRNDAACAGWRVKPALLPTLRRASQARTRSIAMGWSLMVRFGRPRTVQVPLTFARSRTRLCLPN